MDRLQLITSISDVEDESLNTIDARELVDVDLANRSYQIVICTDELPQFPNIARSWLDAIEHWKSDSPKAILVSDSNVSSRYGDLLLQGLRDDGWQAELFTFDAGEAAKSVPNAEKIYDALVEMQADRKTCVIALGGGVVGDLAGFAAATYVRGLPFMQVPTTLLADVDSSVGGKVGVNHPRGKNLIGAFHQPVGVFIDTACLQSLPDRDYRSGLAEVVKYGVILDAQFFEYLESRIDQINNRDPDILREIVAKSCRLKADVVEEDEYEREGLRAILNYGHTFAHAYEALCGYGELTHGEAVAIGMIDASYLAKEMGRIDSYVIDRQVKLLENIHLPTVLPGNVSVTPEAILSCMKLDKKTVAGKLRFVLPSRIGHVEVMADVSESLVQQILIQRLS